MRLHLLITPLKWLLTLGLLGGALFGLFLIHEKVREEHNQDESEEKAAPTTAQTVKGIVKLEEDEAKRYGLETEPARSRQWYDQATIYGRIIPNPRAATEIRSPFAGTLRSAADLAWPTPGQWIRAGQTLGWVDIRVGPDVRLDLQNKLAEARVKQRGAEEEVKVQEDRVNSLKAAAVQEIIARNELDSALVQLTQARTQVATAKAAAEQWNKAIQEVERHKDGDNSLWSHSLAAPCDGEVTDLAARPGMAVESGALIAQLVDFRHPLIRLDFPPELVTRSGPPRNVEMHVPAFSNSFLNGVRDSSRPRFDPPSIQTQLVGPAPRVDATSQFVSYLYDAHLAATSGAKENGSSGLWRPGMQVTARVREESAAAQPAVAVPAGAILFHQGQPLVYVRVEEETYERRAVRILGRQSDCWILAVRQGNQPGGVTAKEPVVSRQAQVLLSKEFLVGTADTD